MLPTLFATGLVFLCIAAGNGYTSAECPPITSRSRWGAHPPTYQQRPLQHPIRRVIVHDITRKPCHTADTCSAALRAIQDEHQHKHLQGRLANQTYSDIVFNFVIGGDGHIYEGRGWNHRGLHAGNYSDSLGVAFIGSYHSRLPTRSMERAFEELVRCGLSTGKIARSYTLHGHRDAVPSSHCPGAMLYRELTEVGTNYGGPLPGSGSRH